MYNLCGRYFTCFVRRGGIYETNLCSSKAMKFGLFGTIDSFHNLGRMSMQANNEFGGVRVSLLIKPYNNEKV